MNFLFIHQNFPGQFRHIATRLSKSVAPQGGKVICLGTEEAGISYVNANRECSNLIYFRYKYLRSNTEGLHHWLLDSESKLIRAESCATACLKLKESGFTPDIIVQHSGWGEGLLVNTVYPGVPILSYQEFFYQPYGTDYDFDPEFQSNHNWRDFARLQIKQSTQLLSLEQSSWNITPTIFQKSTFPNAYQKNFSIIHDGIDCQRIDSIEPFPVSELNQPDFCIKEEESVVTCIMRSVEPYRGCHTLIRAIPHIQRLNSSSTRIIVVGNTQKVSYGSPCNEGSWKEFFLKEIDGQYDTSRVHFVGNLAYTSLISLLKRSNAHIYLTYPFVLSWSLLEAMACRCAIVGSDTAPVREVITDDETGILTDFFDPIQLAEKVTYLLRDSEKALQLGERARELIEHKYSLDRCLPKQIALIEELAGKTINRNTQNWQ